MRPLTVLTPALLLAATLAAPPALAEGGTQVGGLSFPEGPVVQGDRLLFAEYAGHRVSAWDGTARTTLWEEPGCGPSAVAPLGGDLVVTCYDSGTLARIGPDGATVAHYDADGDGAALQGPNDLAPDGAGGVWFTASGPWESAPIVGKVYHLAPDGAVRMLADDLHYANGVSLGPDGRLYVAESEAGRVISFAVGADGALSDRRLFARLAVADPDSGIGAYPDGIEWGPDGNLWVGQYSSGRIVTLDPQGALVAVHDTGAAAAPNLAFAPDGATLFVTAVDQTDGPPYAGRLLSIPLE